MKASIDRQKILLILNWCVKKFGKSSYHKEPVKLRVYNSKGMTKDVLGLRGGYIDGRISIYLGSIKSVKELCETVIHEYKHYQLSEFEFKVYFNRMKKEGHDEDYIYDNHPHEKKAERMEKKYGKQCFDELRSKLYKK